MSVTRLPRVETLATYQRAETWRTDCARSLPHPVLFWVSRGQGRFMIDCKLRGITPNTVIYLPRDTLFSYELFAQPQGTVVSLPNDDTIGLPRAPVLVKPQNVPEQFELTNTFDALSRELSELRSGQRRAIQAHILMLSVALERLLSQYPSDAPDRTTQVLREFGHVVSIGHRDGKSLGEFAADLKVTPTHLTRLTRKTLGKPASSLLQERVIHAACDALRNSDKPVNDIAKHLGFSSPAYFTRAFQAQTGQSPTEFREKPRLN